MAIFIHGMKLILFLFIVYIILKVEIVIILTDKAEVDRFIRERGDQYGGILGYVYP